MHRFLAKRLSKTQGIVDQYFFIIHALTLNNKSHSSSLINTISSESDQEVLVNHYFMLDGEEQACAAPFSWLIHMHLEGLWEESEFMPGLPQSRILYS